MPPFKLWCSNPRTASGTWLWLIAFAMCLPTSVRAQGSGSWILRVGAVGSGTSDEGTWTFKPSTNLGAQVFEFSNSWGAALTAERVLGQHLHLGVHLAYASTDFALTVSPPAGATSFTSRDKTSYVPLLGEVQYGFLPGSRANPRLGVGAGKFFTRDVRLGTDAQVAEADFEFDDPVILSYGAGVDVSVDRAGVWLLSFDVKSTRYEYTLGTNVWVDTQTLLDQDAALSFNHLVLSLGRRF